MEYSEFLKSKRQIFQYQGKDIQPGAIHPKLFPFQRDLTIWACRRGRCAIFADTGLGKTYMQIEWARLMGEKTLIVAPLSVARQTTREGIAIDVAIDYVRDQTEVKRQISITNYEMLDHFNGQEFGAVVLDESSILKGLSGVIKNKLIEMFAEAKYKLCCTATPAPNDLVEIANHAEFLGVMSRTDIMSTFFVHDDEGWRLRGHAKTAFFRWLSSWGMFLRLPSDLGYSDDGYILPPLNIERIQVESTYVPDGQLFAVNIGGIGTRSKVRRGVIEEKLASAVELCESNGDQWIIWCGLNDESSRLAKAIGGAVNIQGSDSIEKKKEGLEGFQDGKLRVLVTKPKIGGFGINLQNCHNQIFFGLSDSWEQYYQCVRRSYRFGQMKEVNVYILIASAEEDILRNVLRKDAAAESLRREMIESIKGFELLEIHKQEAPLEYKQETVYNNDYRLMLGDSCERIKEIESESVGMSIFSPPFLSLYAYSPTERDLGNSRSEEEFFDHFSFLIDELLRVTKPGRNCCVHVSQVPAMLVRDGYIGLKDFRGKTIENLEKHGFVYHGEVCVDKNPQAQAIRTHSKALLFAQLKRDSSWLRPALLDYLLVFRKPGDNAEPVRPELSNNTWIKWAHGVWCDIDETNTLNYREAREHTDDRHICPLQLETIERSLMLWSNPGDLVFSPFMGIGSEGYVAVKNNRRFVGIELKKSYFDVAVKNIKHAAIERDSGSLFKVAT